MSVLAAAAAPGSGAGPGRERMPAGLLRWALTRWDWLALGVVVVALVGPTALAYVVITTVGGNSGPTIQLRGRLKR